MRNRYFPGLILIIQDEYTKNMKDTHLVFAQHLVNKSWFAMIWDLRPWWVHVFVQVGLSLLVLPWKVAVLSHKVSRSWWQVHLKNCKQMHLVLFYDTFIAWRVRCFVFLVASDIVMFCRGKTVGCTNSCSMMGSTISFSDVPLSQLKGNFVKKIIHQHRWHWWIFPAISCSCWGSWSLGLSPRGKT